MGRRVLVTGGAGFLGSHLVDYLVARDDQVTVVDCFWTGSAANVAHHVGKPNFVLLELDITQELPAGLEFDDIYHLACPASPVHYLADPIRTAKTNVVGTLNMLELARQCGARFMLASTSEVYGEPLQHPQPEDYWGNVDCCGKLCCYDEGKRSAEALTMDWHRQYGFPVRIIRLFNTFGPRMAPDDGRVVSNFVAQALQGKPLTLYGSGDQTRSFAVVDDVVQGIVAAMDSDNPALNGPLNMGSVDEFTMRELAELIRDMVNPNMEIIYKLNTSGHRAQRKPDISKAKELLGWEPTTPLKEGLQRMVDDFKQRLKLG